MEDAGDMNEAGKEGLQIPPALTHAGRSITDEDAEPVAVKVRVQLPEGVIDEVGHGAAVGSLQEGHHDKEGLVELSSLPTTTLGTSCP